MSYFESHVSSVSEEWDHENGCTTNMLTELYMILIALRGWTFWKTEAEPGQVSHLRQSA